LAAEVSILETFAKLRSSIGNEAFTTRMPRQIAQRWAVEETVDEFWDLLVTNHLDHRSKHEQFYTRFGYEWVRDRRNFLNPFEALFQFELLRILGDLSPSHPDYWRLKETAVRFIPTANIGAECREVGDYAFILLSTSFIRYIKEIVLALWRLHRIALGGGNNADRSACFTCHNHVFGQDAELAMRISWREAEKVFTPLLAVIFSHLNYEVPCFKSIALTVEMDEAGKPADMLPFGGLYHPVEMFVLCHELAHLLKGDVEKQERSVEEELLADHSAMSLYIIHNSFNARQPLMISHPMSYFVGPVLFFQGMRLLALCRRLVILRECDFQTGANHLLDEERELSARLIMINYSISLYGLKNYLRRAGATFEDISAEFYPIIAGCQKVLMKLWCGIDAPIDQFLGQAEASRSR
jgi:hypothetical protein